MRCRKSKSQHMKKMAAKVKAKVFFSKAKVFLCSIFHMLNFGFSASDLGVKIGGPGLRVYNTFIVLNRVSAKVAVSPQGIETFAKLLRLQKFFFKLLRFRILWGPGFVKFFFLMVGIHFRFGKTFASAKCFLQNFCVLEFHSHGPCARRMG